MAKKRATKTLSAKENAQPRLSSATRPKSASKPLKTQASSLNGAKDAEMTALVASLRGDFSLNWLIYGLFFSAEIDQLKKAQAAKPKEQNLQEIPRPKKVTCKSLQDAMGLSNNKKLYSFCRVSLLSLPFALNVDYLYSQLFEMS